MESNYEQDVLYDLPLSQSEIDDMMVNKSRASSSASSSWNERSNPKSRSHSDYTNASTTGIPRAGTPIPTSMAKETYVEVVRQLIDAETGGEQRSNHVIHGSRRRHSDLKQSIKWWWNGWKHEVENDNSHHHHYHHRTNSALSLKKKKNKRLWNLFTKKSNHMN